jgi:hypothetical protein
MSDSQTARKHSNCGWALIPLLALVVVALFSTAWSATATWCAIAACMVLLVLALGRCINGRAFGVLVNEHNKMSISRLQLVLWTLIVLSAFIAVALKRIVAGPVNIADPLAIAMPWQLWALMGISTASLIGTPLISASKSKKKPAGDVSTREGVGAPPAASFGTIYVRPENEEPGFGDLFRGDEVSNHESIDIAKLQMFFFTLVCALTYVIALWSWMSHREAAVLTNFPALADGLIALLGISHTGYLSSKGIDHTETK